MRRAVQFHLESVSPSSSSPPAPPGQNGQLQLPDLQNALEEIFVQGGSLNAKLLGAARPVPLTFDPFPDSLQYRLKSS